MVAKKDFNAPGHIDLHKIPNLQVIKACQSLTSRGYVKTQFSWQYYYYTLTNEGIGTTPPSLVPFACSFRVSLILFEPPRFRASYILSCLAYCFFWKLLVAGHVLLHFHSV